MHNSRWTPVDCYKTNGIYKCVDHLRNNFFGFTPDKMLNVSNIREVKTGWIGKGYIFYTNSDPDDQDCFLLIPENGNFLVASLRTTEPLSLFNPPDDVNNHFGVFCTAKDLRSANKACQMLVEEMIETHAESRCTEISLTMLRERLYV